jgi:hypothetical protein
MRSSIDGSSRYIPVLPSSDNIRTGQRSQSSAADAVTLAIEEARTPIMTLLMPFERKQPSR